MKLIKASGGRASAAGPSWISHVVPLTWVAAVDQNISTPGL
ncbi:hypothetical protein ACWDXH_15670 [Micromonospora chokoriensis]